MQKRTLLKISIGFSSLFIIESGFAAGFQINELSPTIQATALADAATASGDISGMAYNPATLATIKGTDIYLGGTVLMPDVGYSNAQATTKSIHTILAPDVTPVSGVNSEDNITPSAFIPDAYIGTSLFPRLTDNNLKIGLGLNAPFGLETNYNDDWVGRYNALESKIQVMDVFPTIAYQITPTWSLGASINFENIDATYSNDIYSNIGNGFIVSSGNSSLTGSAWGIGYTIGTMYKITPTTTLGADYHSAVKEGINGTATIAGNVCILDEEGHCHHPLPNSFFPGEGTDSGQVNLTLPAIANLGISQTVGQKLTLMAGAEWTQWDTIPGIDATVSGIGEDNTPLNYSNSWLYSIGSQYQFTPKFSLSGGLAYDETPTNGAYRDARVPGTNRKWITLGCAYDPTTSLALFATYEHIFMNDQNIDLTQQPTPDVSPAHISADYTGYANIVAGGLNYTF